MTFNEMYPNAHRQLFLLLKRLNFTSLNVKAQVEEICALCQKLSNFFQFQPALSSKFAMCKYPTSFEKLHFRVGSQIIVAPAIFWTAYRSNFILCIEFSYACSKFFEQPLPHPNNSMSMLFNAVHSIVHCLWTLQLKFL